MKYNFSKLWSDQFFGFYEFKSFYEYASDKKAQASYYRQLGAIHGDMNGLKKGEIPQALLNGHIQSNESALEMIKNQFIVFLFARYEFIVQDTMKCLLCDNPERILKFIKVYPDYEKSIGFSLKEFIQYDSKEKYVSIMSERLSSKILSGVPSKVIRRLRCLLSFDDVNADILDDLMIKRNNIIHEGKAYKIDLDVLEIYYETIDSLLKNIALALININISVVDHGQILIDG